MTAARRDRALADSGCSDGHRQPGRLWRKSWGTHQWSAMALTSPASHFRTERGRDIPRRPRPDVGRSPGSDADRSGGYPSMAMGRPHVMPTPEREARLRQSRAPQLQSAVAFARACHIGPTLAVTAFTGALAWRSGRDRAGLLGVGAAVLAGQAAVGLSNDYLDRHRDREAGRSDKPIVAGAISQRAVGAGALVAGAACLPLSMLSGRSAALTHFGAIAAGLSYNRWFKFSALSPVPYAVAFGALPSFISLGSVAGSLAPAPITIAATLLGVGAHFINTLPDVDADEQTGVRGLPQRLGPIPSLVIGAGLLGASTAVVAVAAPALGAVGAVLVVGTGVCLAGVVALALTERTRWAWGASLVAAATTVGLAVSSGVVA